MLVNIPYMEHMGWKKSGFHGMFHIFDEKKNMEDAMISIFLHVLFFPSFSIKKKYILAFQLNYGVDGKNMRCVLFF